MRIVVSDANILINLIHVDLLSLLGSLQGLDFVAPDEVVGEVSVPEHAQALAGALKRGWLRQSTLRGTEELEPYAEFRRVMGRGELACLAMAAARGWWIASDQRGRFLRIAKERIGEGRILNTPGLVILAIREGLLSVEQADEAKAVLEQNRFKMKFASFRDVLGEP